MKDLRHPNLHETDDGVSAAAKPKQQEIWRRIARTALSLIVVAVVMLATLFALVLAFVQCDENCPENYDGDWRYTAQFFLAAVAALLTVTAAALGFTARTRAYRLTAVAAGVLSLVWLMWVFGGDF